MQNDVEWTGKEYVIQPSRHGILPYFDIEMPESCDILFLNSHIGKNRSVYLS